MHKAFYVISQQAVKKQVQLWNKYLPFVQPYYAVKSNPDKNILKWLSQAGCNFDCASPREMNEVGAVFSELFPKGQYNPYRDRIIYANPHKSDNDILEVKNLGIYTTVVDSIEGIQDLRQNNYKADVFVRIAVDDSESSSPFSIKFGTHDQDWSSIIDYLYEYNYLYKLKGVSFHVGSGSKNPTQYKKAIETSRRFAQAYHKRWGYKQQLELDIGGGFLPDEANFSEAAQNVKEALYDWKSEEVTTYPKQIIAEPGRFFSAPSHTLYVPIMHKKKTPHGYSYVINESIYGQFSSIPFDHAKPYWISSSGSASSGSASSGSASSGSASSGADATKETTKGIIFGRTCDSIDMIAYSDKMPIMNKGDYLCFPNMGAYTRVSASEFNGFPLPELIYDNNTDSVSKMLVDGNNYVKDGIIFPIETVSKVSLSNSI
jgi:ornithine decarboxylase